MLLKQSTARNLLVFVTQSADHVTGLTGASLTITASKDGGAFGSISPTVTERGSGWYSLALTASHTDTLGDLALHITASSADPADLVRQVVAALPGESVALTAVDTAAVADRLLGRSLAGGADGGRVVRDALRAIRNKTELAAGALTVYAEDDSTPAWTAAVTQATRDPLTAIDPA